MKDPFSREGDPRPPDPRMRAMLGQNRQTIARLADHLTAGAYSASKAPRPEPRPEGLIIHALGGSALAEEPQPVVRIALNGRALMIDQRSGRQMHHLGEVRGRGDDRRFVLATRANGFFAPVEPGIAEALVALDGTGLADKADEDRFAADIATALGLT